MPCASNASLGETRQLPSAAAAAEQSFRRLYRKRMSLAAILDPSGADSFPLLVRLAAVQQQLEFDPRAAARSAGRRIGGGTRQMPRQSAVLSPNINHAGSSRRSGPRLWSSRRATGSASSSTRSSRSHRNRSSSSSSRQSWLIQQRPPSRPKRCSLHRRRPRVRGPGLP